MRFSPDYYLDLESDRKETAYKSKWVYKNESLVFFVTSKLFYTQLKVLAETKVS